MSKEAENKVTDTLLKKLISNPNYAESIDKQWLSPWPGYQKDFKPPITNLEAIGLQIGTKLQGGATLNKNEKLVFTMFLEKSIGNQSINKFLRQGGGLAGDIAYFSYKTRNYDSNKLESLLSKAIELQNLDTATLNQKLPKLTLKELGVISDLSKTCKVLDTFRGGMAEDNNTLSKLYKQAQAAKIIIESFEEKNSRELASFGPGVVILDNISKKSDALAKSKSTVDKLVGFFSKHCHAATLSTENQSAKREQLGVNEAKYSLTSQLYADMYKIDHIALIPKENHSILETAYGSQWQNIITEKMKIAENYIYTNKKTGYVSAHSYDIKGAYIKAGLADLIPYGHKKLTSNNYKELCEKVLSGAYSDEKNPRMLCSEFSATLIASSIVELDNQIKADIKSKGLPVPDRDMIKVPFGKHEDLNKMHPNRLLKVLKNHDCIEPVITKTSEHYIKEAAKDAAKNARKHIATTNSNRATISKIYGLRSGRSL